MCSVNPCSTGDASAAATLDQAEIDKRVKMFVDMEDPELIVDLRELHYPAPRMREAGVM